jgi:hypothetical protein
MPENSFCTTDLTAPGMPPYGAIGGGYLTAYKDDGTVFPTGDIATIKWTDLNNSGYCYNYKNPAIKDYHVQVFQDGNMAKPFIDLPHVTTHGAYTIGGLAEIGIGGDVWWAQFHAPFGHNYSVVVCANSPDGVHENCSLPFAFNSPAPVPIVPATTSTPGKVSKKHK